MPLTDVLSPTTEVPPAARIHGAAAGNNAVCPAHVVAFLLSVVSFGLGVLLAAAQCEQKHCRCPPATAAALQSLVPV